MMPDLSMNAGIGVISSLRIVRILRITRLIRNTGSSTGGAMKVLRALRTLIHSIVYTLKEVVWAAVFLFLIMYVFSLAITQGRGKRTSGTAHRVGFILLHYWGGIPSAMSTCFMAVTGGISWEVASDPLLKRLGGQNCSFESFECDDRFGWGVQCSGILLRSATLRRSGSLTLAELEEHLGDPAVQAYFASMELSITDVWSFFKLLDSDLEAEISPETFFEGCQRLKGFARSLDLAKLMHQSQSQLGTRGASIQVSSVSAQLVK
ncbi:Voltage-dependent N-type calcium channel subunit alpha-1B [Durusdinium trenchii]|uniref:Voltage-dependent N-type calcium channel subunit alpha-1B n=1 Tax=Durusdinium trenchii TaxID=1381693 RepID=A0ABP0PTJ7_9DINO